MTSDTRTTRFHAGSILIVVLAVNAATGADKSMEQQPLFDRVNIHEAWQVTKGSPDILIGVIDSGFDYFHPDLRKQLIPGYYYPGGYHTEFSEGLMHGTMMASIIAAKDDGVGMTGLAPRCRIVTASQGMIAHTAWRLQREFSETHPDADISELQAAMAKHKNELLKFQKDWITHQYSGAAEAIRYLVDHGVRVINFSGDLQRHDTVPDIVWERLEDSFAYAAMHEVVIVLAAGNDNARHDTYPGTKDSVIVVGGTLLNDDRWTSEADFHGRKFTQGSAFGNRISVMAPIEQIVCCVPHEKRFYETSDSPMGPWKAPFSGMYNVRPIGGTSSAAPVVASLAALILSVNPELDAESVIKLIQQGCDDVGAPGYDIHTGHGRVNFGKSVNLAAAGAAADTGGPIHASDLGDHAQ